MTAETVLLSDIAVVLIVAGISAFLFSKMRMPAVIGYLVAGILLGPHTPPFSLVQNIESVNLMASLGVILLMFSIGLDFNLKKLRKIGLFSIIAGSIEILTMMTIGYTLGNLMGWSHLESIFLGAVMSISSTAIIIKVLSDYGKLKESSTEAVIGILIIEDFAAVMILTMAAPLTSGSIVDIKTIISMVAGIVIFILISIILGAAVIPRIINRIAREQPGETLLLVCLGLCFAMSLVSLAIGLSVAIGAFIMGVIISQSDYVEKVIEKITPVKEMFLAIFFVSIGMLIIPALIVQNFLVSILIAIVFIVGKTLSVAFAGYVANLDAKTSLVAGMSMVAMGEFSFIIAKLAIDTGAAGEFFYSTIIGVALITSFVLPFSIKKAGRTAELISEHLPASLRSTLGIIERLRASVREKIATSEEIRKKVRTDITWIFIDITLIFVVTAVANIIYNFTDIMSGLAEISPGLPALIVGSTAAALLIPPVISIMKRIRAIVAVVVHIALDTGRFNAIGGKVIYKVFMNFFTIFIIIVTVIYLISIVPIPPDMPYISPVLILIIGALVAYLFRDAIKSLHQRMSQALSRAIIEDEKSKDGIPPKNQIG
ncbi:MAG: cation:proton antiporter [Methanomassiliicoccales archaeon]|nr:cation:proton antiporter [Methanomassiliicoccales archaeon]